MVFTCLDATKPSSSKKRFSISLKSKSLREVTILNSGDNTFFVCSCGFSSTNKSGSSRHKCRAVADKITHSCKVCGKACQNPGSLKRHLTKMHGSRQSISLPVSSTAADASLKCTVCGKVLASKSNLKNHLSKVHGKSEEKDSTTLESGILILCYRFNFSFGNSY